MRAAVLGKPISHSLSPVLHLAAYQALGIAGEWTYEIVECDERELPEVLDRGWAGLSLTMPLKRAVLPLLDHVEPLAVDVGGANTVVFGADGRRGYNTDVPGMIAALARIGVVKADSATILGAGATACAALAALRDLGEKSVTVAVRAPHRAEPLMAAAARLDIAVTLRPYEPRAVDGARLLISTVPAGAANTFAENFSALVSPPEVVLDVVYHPWPTALATAAQHAGAVLVSGFDLLLHQAGRQVELMTDRPAPLAAMRQAGLAELATRAGGAR